MPRSLHVTVYRVSIFAKNRIFFSLYRDSDNARGRTAKRTRFLFLMHRQRGRDAAAADEAPRRGAPVAQLAQLLRVWDLLISGRGLERHETSRSRDPVTNARCHLTDDGGSRAGGIR